MQTLHRNAIAVWISVLRFAPAHLARVTLCFSFAEGSLFSIAPVWKRVRWRSGGELLALCPVRKNRKWRWRAKKGLTGHLYWCCEVQQWLNRAQSYQFKIHGSAWPIRSSFEYLCLVIREKGKKHVFTELKHIKAALINIFISSMEKMTTCIVKDVAHCDKPTDNLLLTLQFPSALWSILASFISLIWFSGMQL